MKIIYIKLRHFSSVKAAMGLDEIEFDFSKIDKPIIQIYGRNKCGKTVLLQQLHPFSSINLNGDERSDLDLIIPGESGMKHIIYEINGEVYDIKHTYKSTSNGHSVSSSLIHNDEELNTSGGVNTFNTLIDKIFGINKYTAQFIFNGTQLASFASMSTVQRKNLLNKAMGIDIYDKINKLATDDYRYTNKMLTTLSNTREFLMSQWGAYENLVNMLNIKRGLHSNLSKDIDVCKSRMDSLSGKISIIKQQNVSSELLEVMQQIESYDNLINDIGYFDKDTYNDLVQKQISLNNELNDLKTKRLLILKDIDVLYNNQHDINDRIYKSNKSVNDYNDMIALKEKLTTAINNIPSNSNITSSSTYLRNMISLAQVINSTCKEIRICLNDKHIAMFADMISRNIDISAFLVKEGSVVMDSEKEISAISRIRNMMNNVDGEYIDDCCHHDCIYWKTKETLDTYFKAYQSTTESQFTKYDIEQFDHAYKNIQTLRRLVSTELSNEIKSIFSIDNIMMNLCSHCDGIDIDNLTSMMEEAASLEMRAKYVSQLNDIEKVLSMQSDTGNMSTDEMNEKLNDIASKINELKTQINDIDDSISKCNIDIQTNDQLRLKFSSIQNINIKELRNKHKKLMKLSETLHSSEAEYQTLNISYISMSNELATLSNELDSLENANRQYQDNIKDIEKYQSSDSVYKIIAEATSSTKGRPVIVIRDKVESTLTLANRLLEVMYDGEMEFLQPTIDETSFTIPFRNKANISPDVKYGSQSEAALLSFALSLSFASSLTEYNVFTADEVDSFLDKEFASSFIQMLIEMTTVLKIEQMFIISHKVTNVHSDDNPYLHVLNLSDEILNQTR